MDLVKLLRIVGEKDYRQWMLDAADEIERLRAELDFAKRQVRILTEKKNGAASEHPEADR